MLRERRHLVGAKTYPDLAIVPDRWPAAALWVVGFVESLSISTPWLDGSLVTAPDASLPVFEEFLGPVEAIVNT